LLAERVLTPKLLFKMMGLTTSKFKRSGENLAAISWREVVTN